MIVFWVIFSILHAVVSDSGSQDEGRLRFSDQRREPENLDYRTRRLQNNRGGSNIESILKIPIAVIKGTSAAAQAFYPQNTETINKLFDIPVMTLDAVGNYIKERPQRLGVNVDDDTVQQTPVRFDNQRPDRRRDERRERIMKLREQERLERERRRAEQQERFFLGGHHSIGLNDYAEAFADLLVGGYGGGHGGGLFGGHGHGHGHQGIFGKPHKRPLKPIKPLKPHKPHRPGNHGGSHGGLFGGNGGSHSGNGGLFGGNGGSHGSHGGSHGGNGGSFNGNGGSFGGNSESFNDNGSYEVHEQINESPIQSSGIFSWLQTTGQSNYPKIQNKIAPGSEFRNDRDVAEFRTP